MKLNNDIKDNFRYISELWLDERFERTHLLHQLDALCVGSLVARTHTVALLYLGY